MQTERLGMITRRRVVANAALGSAAGAMAVYGRALAQDSAVSARVRGPAVWLDMDQEELDASYDNDAYVTNHDAINERREANNEIALRVVGRPEIVSYGPTEIEKLSATPGSPPPRSSSTTAFSPALAS